MRPTTRPYVVQLALPSLICGLALSIAVSFAVVVGHASEASAQAAVKRSAGSMSRSAGSMNRSSGSRRGSSLGSKTRGHESGTSTERKGSKPSFRSPDSKTSKSDDEDESGRHGVGGGTANAARLDPDGKKKKGDDDEEEAQDYGTRTLGRACMYGARGEVIFRPAGSVCRGDAPPPEALPAAPAPRPAKRDARSKTKRRSGGGRCIVGADGRVIHAPPGVDCRR